MGEAFWAQNIEYQIQTSNRIFDLISGKTEVKFTIRKPINALAIFCTTSPPLRPPPHSALPIPSPVSPPVTPRRAAPGDVGQGPPPPPDHQGGPRQPPSAPLFSCELPRSPRASSRVTRVAAPTASTSSLRPNASSTLTRCLSVYGWQGPWAARPRGVSFRPSVRIQHPTRACLASQPPQLRSGISTTRRADNAARRTAPNNGPISQI